MNTKCADELVSIILGRLSDPIFSKRPLLVGLDGLAGAGKTTLCSTLIQRLAQKHVSACALELDWNYWRKEGAVKVTKNFQFNHNKDAVGEDYDWPAVRRRLISMLSKPDANGNNVIIVEGVFSLRTELRGYYDLRVFVDGPRNVLLERALVRDGERARLYFEKYWKHEEDLYVLRHKPRDSADVVVKME